MSGARVLNDLRNADGFFIKQKIELVEILTGFETKNRYVVKNTAGQDVYHAVEDSGCCNRMCCGPLRAFDMQIFDASQNEVFHLYRPYKCPCCCCSCSLQTMEVSAPPGNVIGRIDQEWTFCRAAFAIKNYNDEIILRIQGPLCTDSLCGGDVNFQILDLSDNPIGQISKKWGGFAREVFSDSDFFGIKFPVTLDVNMKAVLLGATFLIDYMFFEKR